MSDRRSFLKQMGFLIATLPVAKEAALEVLSRAAEPEQNPHDELVNFLVEQNEEAVLDGYYEFHGRMWLLNTDPPGYVHSSAINEQWAEVTVDCG